ncbi:cupin domain-containing protein [Streptococcus gallolyticus]|uniref:cupin domain-containing protein n=1 Tax=Streptococcus gallolyticus TaxID=315405 RepID=UPI0001E0F34C|nr:cupin domain-containing protein [Streptococcus gallolyticus]EFM30143.1 cupin domain protein [Streptococcus gallolyticus subsp. gallolyticus TX20005]MCF0240698.1 cupin domain-containing protein [Streptococcus gallolyticus]QKI01443.1 cupin domain-containing protein [Streptococcus gallolyticus]QWX87514.1 cupin domain-containing protein [Streptococcus gallolyticus subsp. gallolyticus TX20005]
MAYIEKLEHNKVLDLKKIVPIEEEQMLSKTLVQRDDLGMTIFSLDKGQEIGRHSSLGDAMVNVLSGVAKITIADDDYIVKAGESIVMPAEVPHALYAEEAFQMLLIVVKPEVKHD